MRKPLLSLAAVAIVASGCATASAPTSGRYVAPPPEHHLETPPVQEVPRGTPYDGVTFQDPGVNPFVDPLKDNQSTFGLDVDTASYTVARRFVDDGNLPDPASVRVEEFVNYFDQGYTPPALWRQYDMLLAPLLARGTPLLSKVIVFNDSVRPP